MLHDRNWTEKWVYIKFMKLALNGKCNSKRVIIELKKKFVDSTQIVDTMGDECQGSESNYLIYHVIKSHLM